MDQERVVVKLENGGRGKHQFETSAQGPAGGNANRRAKRFGRPQRIHEHEIIEDRRPRRSRRNDPPNLPYHELAALLKVTTQRRITGLRPPSRLLDCRRAWSRGWFLHRPAHASEHSARKARQHGGRTTSVVGTQSASNGLEARAAAQTSEMNVGHLWLVSSPARLLVAGARRTLTSRTRVSACVGSG